MHNSFLDGWSRSSQFSRSWVRVPQVPALFAPGDFDFAFLVSQFLGGWGMLNGAI